MITFNQEQYKTILKYLKDYPLQFPKTEPEDFTT